MYHHSIIQLVLYIPIHVIVIIYNATLVLFFGLVEICPSGAVAAAHSAHHGKSCCAEICRDQNPNMVKGQRWKICNYHCTASTMRLETEA
jgi:hypothetical protein